MPRVARTLAPFPEPVGHTGAVHPTIVIYSRPARITAYLVISTAVAVTAWSLWRDGFAASAPFLPYVWIVAWVGWVLWGQPRVQLSAEGVYARNLVTWLALRWDQIEEVEANYGLVLHCEGKAFRLAAAPPRSGLSTLRRTPLPQDLPHIDFSAKQVHLDLDTNQAMRLLEYMREEFAGDTAVNDLFGPSPTGKVKHLHWPLLSVVFALVCLLFVF